MAFHLYHLGAEQSGWRDLLHDAGIEHVGASYWSLRKRIPKAGIDFVDWGFPNVMLDSGGHAANKSSDGMSVGDWRKYADEYAIFARSHSTEVSLITEFDCLALGAQWIRDQRKDVWSDFDKAKFLPVWHPEHGLDELNDLGAEYGQVAISEDAVGSRSTGLNITPHLNSLARDGVRLHGVAMTKPAVLRSIQFSSASSTSWLSPMRFGDTIVWNNGTLTRYPMKMKTQARQRHAALFEEHGFDAQKILDDDKTEVTRFALWSWRQQEESISASWDDGSNSVVARPAPSIPPTEGSAVDTQGDDDVDVVLVRKTVVTRADEDRKTLPMFSTRTKTDVDLSTGEDVHQNLLIVRGTSPRQCNSCVVKAKCPEFLADSTCAYSMPSEVGTPEQKKALIEGMLSMQTDRVGFMRLVEELNGGYADPNLSQEIDRLMKIMNTQNDLENGGEFSISIKGKGQAGGGVLSSLFGGGNAARALPAPRVIEQEDTDSIMSRLAEGKKVT